MDGDPKPTDATSPPRDPAVLDDATENDPAVHNDAAENDPAVLRMRVEAALLIAGSPIGLRRLTAVTGLPDATATRAAIERLNDWYDSAGRAMRIETVAGGYQMLTRGHLAPWLSRLSHLPPPVRLSLPMLETLAVVAYRGPVSRADIERVRGVACGELLRQLMERDLVRLAGRSEELGRPYLYGTTKTFLNVFGLRDVSALPQINWDPLDHHSDASDETSIADPDHGRIADNESSRDDTPRDDASSANFTDAPADHSSEPAAMPPMTAALVEDSPAFTATTPDSSAIETDHSAPQMPPQTSGPAAVIEDEEDDLYEEGSTWDDDDDDDWDDPDDDDDIVIDGDDEEDEAEEDEIDDDDEDLDDDWEEVDGDELDEEFEGDEVVDDDEEDDDDWGEDDEEDASDEADY